MWHSLLCLSSSYKLQIAYTRVQGTVLFYQNNQKLCWKERWKHEVRGSLGGCQTPRSWDWWSPWGSGLTRSTTLRWCRDWRSPRSWARRARSRCMPPSSRLTGGTYSVRTEAVGVMSVWPVTDRVRTTWLIQTSSFELRVSRNRPKSRIILFIY